MVLKEFEFVIIRNQTKDCSTELPQRMMNSFYSD